MIALFRKFVLDDPTPREIARVQLPVNDEKWEAIQQKIDAAKESLGEKYLCHASNRVQRKEKEQA